MRRPTLRPLVRGLRFGFNPIGLLFPTGQGGHFFSNDLATRYQESTGVTPAAINQPEGFVGDKRLGFVRGPRVEVNGDFSGGATGWTVVGADATHIVTFAGGTCRYQSDTTTPVLFLAQAVDPLVVGKTYEITTVTSAWTSGSLKTDCFTTANLGLAGGVGTSRVIAVASTAVFSVVRNSASVDITIDSISIRMIDGNHATQATAAARPTLSAKVNTVLNSEVVGGTGPWNAGAVFVVENNSLACASGPAFLTKISATATAAVLTYIVTVPSSFPFTVSFYVHTGTRTNIEFLIRNGTTTAQYANESLTNAGVMSGATWQATTIGGGIYRVRTTVTTGFVAGDLLQVYYGTTGGFANGLHFFVGGMTIELGSVATRYQRVTSATDYDTVGFPFFDSLDGTQQHTTSTTGGGSTAGFNYWGTVCPTGGAGTNRTIYDDGAYRVRINGANKLELGAAKTMVYGPELVVNGTFATDTDWTKGTGWVIAAGVATATAVANSVNIIPPLFFTTVVGKTYQGGYDAETVTAGGFQLLAFDGSVNIGDGGTQTATALGVTFSFVATSTTTKLYVTAVGTTSGTIDNITCREKISHHLVETAATVAVGAVAVGTVWQEPRARINLLLKTEDLGGASWGLYLDSGATATAEVVVDPVKGNVLRLTKTAGANNLRFGIFQGGGGLTGNDFAVSIQAKINVAGTAGSALYIDAAKLPSGLHVASAALSGAVGVWASYAASGNAVLAGGFSFYVLPSGPVGSSIDIAFPQLELAATATTYQRVNTGADFDDKLICAQLGNGTVARTGCITALAGGPGYTVGRDHATATSFFPGRLYPAARVVTDVTAVTRERGKLYFAGQAGAVL